MLIFDFVIGWMWLTSSWHIEPCLTELWHMSQCVLTYTLLLRWRWTAACDSPSMEICSIDSAIECAGYWSSVQWGVGRRFAVCYSTCLLLNRCWEVCQGRLKDVLVLSEGCLYVVLVLSEDRLYDVLVLSEGRLKDVLVLSEDHLYDVLVLSEGCL